MLYIMVARIYHFFSNTELHCFFWGVIMGVEVCAPSSTAFKFYKAESGMRAYLQI